MGNRVRQKRSNSACSYGSAPHLVLPDGQNTPAIGQWLQAKIFHFTEIRKQRMFAATRPKEEGRIAIVTTRAGTAVGVGHIGAKGFAGRATVSETIARTTGVVRVRQNRVVLASGVCAPSLVVMCDAQPGAHISHLQGDGGNSASLPGESTT
jgi:hypothetical protein